MAGALHIAQVAASLGRRVWVCHTMRSYAALREARQRVRDGRLHITQITGYFGIPRRRNQGMVGANTRSWIDNLLRHHGCHQIDSSLWVLGMPGSLHVRALFGPSQAHRTALGQDTVDSARVKIRTPQTGIRAVLGKETLQPLG